MNTKRGNMPAYPDSITASPAGDVFFSSTFEGCGGMTIREQLAMSNMAALLSFYGDGQDFHTTTREAVRCADLLLAELEKELQQ